MFVFMMQIRGDTYIRRNARVSLEELHTKFAVKQTIYNCDTIRENIDLVSLDDESIINAAKLAQGLIWEKKVGLTMLTVGAQPMAVKSNACLLPVSSGNPEILIRTIAWP